MCLVLHDFRMKPSETQWLVFCFAWTSWVHVDLQGGAGAGGAGSHAEQSNDQANEPNRQLKPCKEKLQHHR